MKTPALVCICLALWAIALAACGSTATQVPSTAAPAMQAPGAGDMAPDFTLPDSKGSQVHLAEELKSSRAIVLVFYQGST